MGDTDRPVKVRPTDALPVAGNYLNAVWHHFEKAKNPRSRRLYPRSSPNSPGWLSAPLAIAAASGSAIKVHFSKACGLVAGPQVCLRLCLARITRPMKHHGFRPESTRSNGRSGLRLRPRAFISPRNRPMISTKVTRSLGTCRFSCIRFVPRDPFQCPHEPTFCPRQQRLHWLENRSGSGGFQNRRKNVVGIDSSPGAISTSRTSLSDQITLLPNWKSQNQAQAPKCPVPSQLS